MYRAVSVIQVQKIGEEVRKKYDLTVPTYSVDLPNGNKQVYEYDEESIKDKATPQEDLEKWNAYQKELNECQAEINEKTSAYMFYDGIECEIDQDWIDKQKWLGIDLPENKFDLKVRYVTTELLKTADDIKNAILEIMKLSTRGVDQSAVKAAENTFRSVVPDRQE